MSAEALIRRVTERYPVSDISIEEPELESIIRRIYLEGYGTKPHRRRATRDLPHRALRRIRQKGVRARSDLPDGSLHQHRLAARAALSDAHGLDGALRAERRARGVPLHAIITYTTVALLMSLVLDIDRRGSSRPSSDDGTIATDFMKPINVPLYFFSDGIGRSLLSRAC